MVEPKKCGVKFKPPALIIDYVIVASGKLRRRTIPIPHFDASTAVKQCAQSLKCSKHSKYLEKISYSQLERLLNRIQSSNDPPAARRLDRGETEGGSPSPDEENGAAFTDDLDLNKATDEELETVKAHMNKTFEANQKLPGDEGYEYDVEIDFDKGDKIESGWDEGNDSNEDDEF